MMQWNATNSSKRSLETYFPHPDPVVVCFLALIGEISLTFQLTYKKSSPKMIEAGGKKVGKMEDRTEREWMRGLGNRA